MIRLRRQSLMVCALLGCSNQRMLQKPVLGPVLLSISISDLEGMTQCTFSKFACDMNLGGCTCLRAGLSFRTDRREKLVKFNKLRS